MTPKSEQKKKQRLVLIDAHAIIHRAYHALPGFTSAGKPTGGLYGLSSILIKLIGDLGPDYLAACFDLPGPTFRHETYEQYKAQRPDAEEDLIYQLNRSRDVFRAFHIPIYEHEGFEADDIIGTITEQMRDKLARGNIEVLIASGDMDTLQLVDDKRVRVYTMRKGLADTVTYDEAAVRERFGFAPELIPDFKGLKGDPSDNIPGVRGIGEKTAKQIIAAIGSLEEIYRTLSVKPEVLRENDIKDRVMNLLRDEEEEAYFSKTLATIRRDVPIMFTLPDEPWHETFNTAEADALFDELQFRSLIPRLRQLAGAPAGERGADETGADTQPREDVHADDVARIAVALWLVDSNITNPSREDILRFADTQSFTEAKARILEQVKQRGLERVYYEIELPLIPILRAAEERGIRIDTEYLRELSTRLSRELETLRGAIFDAVGMEFNVNSPAQLADALFNILGLPKKGIRKTTTGQLSTRESELEKLRGAHPVIEQLLEYRELQKLLSTYIDAIPKAVNTDGRLHTTFLQTGTTTGRLSSANPNLQNIPVRGERGAQVRRAFIAGDGRVLAALDYSQIELRVLAFLSGDDTLKGVFKTGGDIHTSVAARVFGVSEDNVEKDMRRAAKVINFGIIYGMGVTSLQKNLNATRAEAQSFYDNYFAQFPGVTNYLQDIKRTARAQGYTKTLFGRRRTIDGLSSSIPYIRAAAERMAINAPIQGTAADIIKLAMVRVNELLAKENMREAAPLILQIHDELVYEIDTERVDKLVPRIRAEMEQVLETDVPLVVDASVGASWGEMKNL